MELAAYLTAFVHHWLYVVMATIGSMVVAGVCGWLVLNALFFLMELLSNAE